MSQATVLQVRDATVGIHGRPVVTDVNFSLKAGEIGVLIGPNGAGKSTLLKSCVGLISLIVGSIQVHGREVGKMTSSERAKLLSWVPQEESSEFAFPVYEYVAMARLARSATMFETSEDHAAVVRALEMTDAMDLADRPITELSGGEHQRVLIARALAQETDLIVLDEPLSHLDIHHQMEVLRVLDLLSKAGKALLLSVHDLAVASKIHAQTLLVHEGRIAFQGGFDELMKREILSDAFQHRFERISLSDGSQQVVPVITTIGR